MPDQTHVASIADSFLDPRPWAECSCGWTGPKRKTKYEAMTDYREHLEEAEEASRHAERTA